jgi:hypothetical protein
MNEIHSENSLDLEVQLMQALCYYNLNQIEQAEGILFDLLEHLDPSPD